MNKVMLGLILTVCLLGMLLVMLNERLGRKTETAHTGQTVAEATVSAPAGAGSPAVPDAPGRPIAPAEPAGAIPAGEPREAKEALAPPADRARIPAPREEAGPASVATLPPVAAPPAAGVPREPAPVVRPAPKPESVPEPEPAPETRPAPQPGRGQQARPAPKPEAGPDAPRERKPAETRKPEQKPAARPAGNTISRFVVYSRDKGATVRIGASRAIRFSSMTLENPDRVVVDLDGHWEFPPNPGIPRNDLVSNVRIGKNGDKTRVVIDLKGKPRVSRVVTSGGGETIDVRVDR